MKFAIVGMGFIYPRHVQAIEYIGGKVSMTCDIDKTKQTDFTDWVEMFNHPDFEDIDAVAILTPNHLHTVIAREARLRGKRVLCEKPLSINGTKNLEGVNTVLQLRHHPALKNLEPGNIVVEAKMFRDDVSFDRDWET